MEDETREERIESALGALAQACDLHGKFFIEKGYPRVGAHLRELAERAHKALAAPSDES